MPGFEALCGCRQVKGHEVQRAPACVVVDGGADQGTGGIKLSAREPQFAIQWLAGPAIGEPGRCVDTVASAGPQDAAVPARTDTIEFFADQVLADIGAVLPGAGQHQGGRCRAQRAAGE